MSYRATGASIYFRILCKIAVKWKRACKLIASIFGTNEEHVQVDSNTKFAVNLRNIHR